MARGWFKGHKAEWLTDASDPRTAEAVVIKWSRPDTSSYAVKFVVAGNSVVALGDLGEAVYCFGTRLRWEFLRRCDWHYFVNKCCASETGRNYTMKIPGIGHPVTNVRAIAHYVGLQAALAQLLDENSEPKTGIEWPAMEVETAGGGAP